MYVFSIPEKYKATVVRPFLKGQYSRIDRAYVEQHFPNDPYHRLYFNRRVLDRDPSLKEYWEEKIGVTLSEDAEVWSKPKLEDEVYGHSTLKFFPA